MTAFIIREATNSQGEHIALYQEGNGFFLEVDIRVCWRSNGSIVCGDPDEAFENAAGM